MTRALLPAVLIASAISASAAFGEVTPRPGAHDNRVRIATWTEGQVYRVVTSLTRVTTVEFGEGETIRSIIAGDTVGFQFDGVPDGRAFAIKPAASGGRTGTTGFVDTRFAQRSVRPRSSRSSARCQRSRQARSRTQQLQVLRAMSRAICAMRPKA